MGNIVRALSEDGSALCAALDSTEMVRELARLHNSSAAVTAALGRMATACSLMGCMLKYEDDKLTLRLNGGGPCGTLTAVSDYKGNVKCCAGNARADAPDIDELIGNDGTLTVIKDLGLKEPYVGQIAISTGNIARLLTEYYTSSEQLPTIFALGTVFDENGGVERAGGYMVQAVPPVTEKTITALEQNLARLEETDVLFGARKTPGEIALSALEGLGGDILDEWDAAYRCDCSRERTAGILVSLGRAEIERLAAEQEETEVCCHFCNKKYKFSADEMLNLLK